jgi:hypothetical protein
MICRKGITYDHPNSDYPFMADRNRGDSGKSGDLAGEDTGAGEPVEE